MHDRSPIADGPAVSFVNKSNGVKLHSRTGDLRRPGLAAGSGRKDLAARADGPSVRAVDKENVRQAVAAAFGQTQPAHTAIVAAQHEPVVTRGPAGVGVGKEN